MGVTTEHQEQSAVIRWSDYHSSEYPELRHLFAIPNGAATGQIGKRNLKYEGLRRGVPDLMLPVARQGYHGLFIEMKKPGGEPSKEQVEWLDFLAENEYNALLCVGRREAVEALVDYLGIKCNCIMCLEIMT